MRSSLLNLDLQEARVVATRQITTECESIKMHTEIELPRGTFYRAGDYLTVLPSNSREVVLRALRHFQMPVRCIPTRHGLANICLSFAVRCEYYSWGCEGD